MRSGENGTAESPEDRWGALLELVHEIVDYMHGQSGSVTMHFKHNRAYPLTVDYKIRTKPSFPAPEPPVRAQETDRPPPRALDP